jgi:hypothetical protein
MYYQEGEHTMNSWRLEYTIDVDDTNAIVRARIYGLWNDETAEAYHRDFKESAGPLLGLPWAKVIDLTAWKTSYETVIKIMAAHMAWSRQNAVALQLYILDNPSTFRQLNRMFEKGGVRDISHTFRTRDEAEQFLEDNWNNKSRN